MEQFKPCPFCGKKSSLLVDHDELNWFFVICAPSDSGCGATGSSALTRGEAIEKWNNRYNEESNQSIDL